MIKPNKRGRWRKNVSTAGSCTLPGTRPLMTAILKSIHHSPDGSKSGHRNFFSCSFQRCGTSQVAAIIRPVMVKILRTEKRNSLEYSKAASMKTQWHIWSFRISAVVSVVKRENRREWTGNESHLTSSWALIRVVVFPASVYDRHYDAQCFDKCRPAYSLFFSESTDRRTQKQLSVNINIPRRWWSPTFVTLTMQQSTVENPRKPNNNINNETNQSARTFLPCKVIASVRLM